jgi:hypothetical protein
VPAAEPSGTPASSRQVWRAAGLMLEMTRWKLQERCATRGSNCFADGENLRGGGRAENLPAGSRRYEKRKQRQRQPLPPGSPPVGAARGRSKNQRRNRTRWNAGILPAGFDFALDVKEKAKARATATPAGWKPALRKAKATAKNAAPREHYSMRSEGWLRAMALARRAARASVVKPKVQRMKRTLSRLTSWPS